MSLSTSSATPAPIMTKADLEKDTITASRPFRADRPQGQVEVGLQGWGLNAPDRDVTDPRERAPPLEDGVVLCNGNELPPFAAMLVEVIFERHPCNLLEVESEVLPLLIGIRVSLLSGVPLLKKLFAFIS